MTGRAGHAGTSMGAASAPELYFYVLVLAYMHWHAFWEGSRFSADVSTRLKLPGLRPGWMLGRGVDLSDVQWREFRASLIPLGAALTAFASISRLAQAHKPSWRLPLCILAALLTLGVLHGACAIKVLILLTGNYWLSQRWAAHAYGPLVIWSVHMTTLVLVRTSGGIPLAHFSPSLARRFSFSGLLRWEIHYPLLMLRMISYSMDLHWARRRHAALTMTALPQACDAQQAYLSVGSKHQVSGSADSIANTGSNVTHRANTGSDVRHRAAASTAAHTSKVAQVALSEGLTSTVSSRKEHQPYNPPPPLQQHSTPAAARSAAVSHPPCYSFSLYLAYALYPPLYIAGPIMTYDDFAAQMLQPAGSLALHKPIPAGGTDSSNTVKGRCIAVPQPIYHITNDGAKDALLRPETLTARTSDVPAVLKAGLRWLLCWLLLEVLTHTLYFNSIAKHKVLTWLEARYKYDGNMEVGGGMALQPLQYALTGFWVLVFMWLKFLVIWRFFTLAALAEGIVAPENMRRCVCNNYEINGFWRHWHASYNAWLLRYVYIPMGGNRHRVLNAWVVFTFVALWHDLEWRLLGWAWLMVLFLVPEMVAHKLSSMPALRSWHGTWLYRQLCAAAAACNILALMVGNLVGFVVGLDGVKPLLAKVLGQPSFVMVMFTAFFSAAQVMFWLRSNQARKAHAVLH